MTDENDERSELPAAGAESAADSGRGRQGERAAPRWRKRELEHGEAQQRRPDRDAGPRAKGPRAPARSAYAGERVAKAIARAGLGSRRDAEAWIAAGRVSVNGRVLNSPAINVVESDVVMVNGKPLSGKERTRLWLFHKPRGTITTDSDPEGRPTIFDVLPPDLPRVVTIGRLDFNTEGLMLLTNDGGLARVLELPSTGWLRRYRVRANGNIDQAALAALAAGVTIDGIHYAGIDAVLDRSQGANVWLTLGLREGKNREVKRVLEHLGLAVNRLIRLSFGPFQLGEAPEASVVEVRTRVLRDQLGEALAREAGADFDAPIRNNLEPQTAGSDAPRRPRGRPDEERRPASPDPGQNRKHVSALRAESAEARKAGPRQRIERDATADRRGREISVERIHRKGVEPDRSSRNGRRFADPKEGDRKHRPFRPDRASWRSGEADKPREAQPAQRRDERPGKGFGDQSRPRSDRERGGGGFLHRREKPRDAGLGAGGHGGERNRPAEGRRDERRDDARPHKSAAGRGFGHAARDDRPRDFDARRSDRSRERRPDSDRPETRHARPNRDVGDRKPLFKGAGEKRRDDPREKFAGRGRDAASNPGRPHRREGSEERRFAYSNERGDKSRPHGFSKPGRPRPGPDKGPRRPSGGGGRPPRNGR